MEHSGKLVSRVELVMGGTGGGEKASEGSSAEELGVYGAHMLESALLELVLMELRLVAPWIGCQGSLADVGPIPVSPSPRPANLQPASSSLRG